jgi:hypothetical protein
MSRQKNGCACGVFKGESAEQLGDQPDFLELLGSGGNGVGGLDKGTHFNRQATVRDYEEAAFASVEYGWQRGHQNVVRAPGSCLRDSMAVPQRRHGWPVR